VSKRVRERERITYQHVGVDENEPIDTVDAYIVIVMNNELIATAGLDVHILGRRFRAG